MPFREARIHFRTNIHSPVTHFIFLFKSKVKCTLFNCTWCQFHAPPVLASFIMSWLTHKFYQFAFNIWVTDKPLNGNDKFHLHPLTPEQCQQLSVTLQPSQGCHFLHNSTCTSYSSSLCCLPCRRNISWYPHSSQHNPWSWPSHHGKIGPAQQWTYVKIFTIPVSLIY